MADYILSCCSTADLGEAQFRARDIQYIYFHYEIDGKEYLDDLGKSLSFEKFYQEMAQGAETHTSQVNVGEFIAYFAPFLEQGLDILHVCLSSGLSGVYNAAQTAKAALRELYPQRQIGIIDSLSASSGYGLLMDKLADLRDGKMAFASLCQWAETHKLEVQHWFFSTDLSYYVKGGRITKAAGWVGTLLSVFPLLNMDEQGRLLPQQKVHGKKQVIREMVQRMVRYAQGGLSYAGKCYISHSACLTEAQAVATEIEATFHQLCGKVEINHIGTAIGSHTGPGTVALFFWGDKRAAEMA